MNIKLKVSPNMWHERHDMINIKFIFILSVLISVFMVSLAVGNKAFFTPQIYFPKSLSQNIVKARLNVTTDHFAKLQNKTVTDGNIANYADFKIPQLIEKLSNATPAHQRLSIFSLSTQGIEAAKYLAKLGTPAIEPLTAALNDPRPMVRGNAALALGMIKDNAATKAIVALLDDKNPIVRMKTAMALASADNPQATAALIKALNDEEAEVRAEAVRALAGREDYTVKNALYASLNDQSWLVRSEIEAALQ